MGQTTDKLEHRYQTCYDRLQACDQLHALRWWAELDQKQRDRLLTDLESIPWSLLGAVMSGRPQTRLSDSAQPCVVQANIEPAPVYAQSPRGSEATLYKHARKRGAELLQMGKVAVFTVAGGQGTRLGYDGPKGIIRVTPAGNRSLFALFAAMVLAARERYRSSIPWYIMTSPANHRETVAYFADNDWFGIPRSDVTFFAQGTLPTFDLAGRLLLASKDRLALAPDGHGGSLKALAASGALADMRRRGIEIISYFQVDNPLIMPFDPLFLGLHAELKSEMSTKVTAKSDDLERMGNVCVKNGSVAIVEYTDFPEALAHARNPDGSRTFNAGNLATHLLDVSFVERIVGDTFQLPLRQARKIVPFVDEAGHLVLPSEPNAIKLESFVFDALPLAERTLVLEVDRGEEFSPVKNASGVDSLESTRRDQVHRACRWLEAAGVTIPRDAAGEPNVTVDIAPSFALDAQDVRAQADRLPTLKPGDVIEIV